MTCPLYMYIYICSNPSIIFRHVIEYLSDMAAEGDGHSRLAGVAKSHDQVWTSK